MSVSTSLPPGRSPRRLPSATRPSHADPRSPPARTRYGADGGRYSLSRNEQAMNPLRASAQGALFKTPFDCEEEKSAGGVVRFAVGTIWAAVVGVEDPPGLEMPEDSFDGRPQSRDDSVVSFISLAERAAGGLFSGSGHAAALVAFVSDAAAGAPHDFGNGRLIERGRVMSFPRERIGNVDLVAVKKAHQLGVESGRAVLAAPQFRMVAVGPAGGDRAVDQADSALDQLDGVLRVRHEFFQHRFHDRHQSAHDSRDRGLRHVPQIAQEFLRGILPQVHARDLDRIIQAARLPPAGPLIPRLSQCVLNTQNKLLHLREHQACSTIVSQRFSRGMRIHWPELSNCFGRIVVSYDDTPGRITLFMRVLETVLSRSSERVLNNTLRSSRLS